MFARCNEKHSQVKIEKKKSQSLYGHMNIFLAIIHVNCTIINF